MPVRVIGIPAAGIRQDEDPGALEALRLHAERDGRAGASPTAIRRAWARREDRAKQRHAQERHHLGTPATNLAPQPALAGPVFLRSQRVDPGRASGNQIRDAIAPLGKTIVFFRLKVFRHQTGIEQQLPESVGMAGEMMTDRRGADAGVDPHEQEPHGRHDAILQTPEPALAPELKLGPTTGLKLRPTTGPTLRAHHCCYIIPRLTDVFPSVAPIRVDRVSKRFGTTVALDQVSMEVRRGEIFGLLGPNGAGKTTLLRSILDIIKPDSGRIELFGHPFRPADRDRIGYLPEERGLYLRQPVGAVLEYLGSLKGLAPSVARAETAAWLDRFGLSDAAEKKVEQLSKGNQQKVQIAATLLARPPVVILDEPLSGLDPLGARMVTGIIRDYAAGGQAVLLSTHQMSMVEALCTRIFMIAHGRGVLHGELRDIKQQFAKNSVRVRSTADYRACPFVERVDSPASGDQPAEVHLNEIAGSDDFLRWLVTSGAQVESFERMSTPLEEIFVRVAEGGPEVV